MTKQEFLDWVTNNGEFSYSDRKNNVGLYSADYGFCFVMHMTTKVSL